LEQIVRARALHKISLYIDPQNTGARKFYERNGFAFIGDKEGMCYFEKQAGFVIAIHQPNFFPWLGYFDKIIRSDIFVFLDDAQLQKTGGGWSNRVQLAIAGEAKWFTAPVNRNFHGTATINNITFDEKVPWRDKLIKTLELNYRKAAFYNEAINFLKGVIKYPEQNVALYNSYCIRAILDQLKMKSNLVVASGMNVTENATERLIVITKKSGGNVYLCGGGAGGYQEDHLFSEAGIDLKYQDFKPTVYDQNGMEKFIAGLSIIDVIMHCGFEGTRQLLYNGT
ncbi:MAG TPA: WbqC family protein, partial [Ferruginibacter sp.]|nr:WbqC family protein [Ferruginibacter sp.]